MYDLPRSFADTMSQLPPAWPDDPFPAVRAAVRSRGDKVVVLDDDPTGTQTVHDIPVLTTWPVEALCAELTNDLPACYLLTNSRSLPLDEARALNAEIGHHLATAAAQTGRQYVVVSRSDSTLRGHYPGEVEALAEALGGGFDATLIIPAFFDGGRYTIDDIHYVADGDRLLPAGTTEFARDAAFGYHASNLRHWVVEKSHGRIVPAAVTSLTLEDIRHGGPGRVAERLRQISAGGVCVVNAASHRDLAVVVAGLLEAEAAGRRFMYRTAASFVPLRAGLESRPLLTRADLHLPSSGGGLVVVGSHVPKTSGQLAALLARPGVRSIEVSVTALLSDDGRHEIDTAVGRAEEALQSGHDLVIYTSRELVAGADAANSLAIGRRVSDGLSAIVRAITTQPRYLIAKGGITSSDVATRGLDVMRAMVLGQVLPGVPVWQLGPESRRPGMVYIVFPGNVGGPGALAEIVSVLSLKG
jgi:uncharacterized protein YgbK (DUF1537 family)